MSDLDKAWAERWIRGCAQAASEHREELIDLDRAIGDADHGENVVRGFQAVVKKVRPISLSISRKQPGSCMAVY